MKPECLKQLSLIFCYLYLKHNTQYEHRKEEIANFWDGPLLDNNVCLSNTIFTSISGKDIGNLIEQFKDFYVNPQFNIDFFWGIFDGLGNCFDNQTRIKFRSRQLLKEFLESSEHGFNIEFGSLKDRPRTKELSFIKLPKNGHLDKYFAGVLTSAYFCIKKGEPFLRVSTKCKKVLDNLGIIYFQEKIYVFISFFYLHLFAGDIPFNIYMDFISRAKNIKRKKYKIAPLDALKNWEAIHKNDPLGDNNYPFLRNDMYYFHNKIFLKPIKKEIKENKTYFIDDRVVSRCERWYTMSKQFTDAQNTID